MARKPIKHYNDQQDNTQVNLNPPELKELVESKRKKAGQTRRKFCRFAIARDVGFDTDKLEK